MNHTKWARNPDIFAIRQLILVAQSSESTVDIHKHQKTYYETKRLN